MPRDTAGNYTLPAGNPVASGEIISASWANSTMNDLGQSLSASLDRYGRGGMLAPFQFTDGTASAPGATWSNEPTTGLYRAAYGDLRFTLTGADVQRWTSANAYLWRNSQWEEILTQTGGGGDTTINNLVVTGSFTSPGIDDNATSTAITIDANENVGIGTDPVHRLTVGDSSANARWSARPTGDQVLIYSYRTDTNTYSELNHRAYSYSFNIGTGSDDRKFVLSHEGNLGIGTDVPDGKLSVFSASAGSVSADADADELVLENSGNVGLSLLTASTGESSIYFGNPGSGGNKDFSLKYYHESHPDTVKRRSLTFNNQSQQLMCVNYNGNVGIGTSTPAGKLSVAFAVSTNGLYLQNTSGTSDYARFEANTTTGEIRIGGVDASSGAYFPTFYSKGTERMRIDSSGSINIGAPVRSGGAENLNICDTAPELAFKNNTVASNGDVLGKITALSCDGTGAFDNRSGANIQFIAVGSSNTYYQPAAITFSTNSSSNSDSTAERMRIDASGNLLVGTTSASGKLTASNGGSGTGVYILQSSSGSNLTPLLIHNDYLNGSNTGTLISFERSDGSPVGSISATGSTTSYNPASDARLKENIRDYDNALADVMKLKPRKYSWKADGAEDNGFIAQELLETPEFANRVNPISNDDDPLYGVDYMKFVTVLVKAMQEQQAMIETLQAEVAALKKA